MQRETRTLSLSDQPAIVRELFTDGSVFFDIETTGFSPRTTDLYLIGLATRQGEDIVIEQRLADSAEEQGGLLSFLLTALARADRLISYNGPGFDIPYLKEKLRAHGLFDPFPTLSCLDLYQEIRSVQRFLSLPDKKQKSVEQFLRIPREDTYSGGDLIPIYRHYAATKDPLPKKLLLLHNYEDVLGMIKLLPALSYPRFLSGDFTVAEAAVTSQAAADGTTAPVLIATLHPNDPFPVPICSERDAYTLALSENEAVLTVHGFSGELKYFFPDPENYDYLPEEDIAIHRSVGDYVGKEHRKRATKATCYTRRTGCFLPQETEIFTPAFRRDYKDKARFFEVPENIDYSSETFLAYLRCCLTVFKG